MVKVEIQDTKLAFKKIYKNPRSLEKPTFLIQTDRDVISFSILGLVLMLFTIVTMLSFSFVIMIVPTLFELLSISFMNTCQDKKHKKINFIIFLIHLTANLVSITLCFARIPYDILFGCIFILSWIIFISGFGIFHSVFSFNYPKVQNS